MNKSNRLTKTQFSAGQVLYSIYILNIKCIFEIG